MKKTLISGFFSLTLILFLCIVFPFSSCNEKEEYQPVCTELTPECEIQKRYCLVYFDSTLKDGSYDVFGDTITEGWYIRNSISKNLFRIHTIENHHTRQIFLKPEETLLWSKLQTNKCSWKIDSIQTGKLSFPSLQSSYRVKILCISGAEIRIHKEKPSECFWFIYN